MGADPEHEIEVEVAFMRARRKNAKPEPIAKLMGEQADIAELKRGSMPGRMIRPIDGALKQRGDEESEREGEEGE